MDNCNKCLYQPICNTYARLGVTDLPESDITPCELFKDKTNVVEVVHGEWKVVSMTGAKRKLHCNQCGYFRETHLGEFFPKICEKCGAVMDGRGEV